MYTELINELKNIHSLSASLKYIIGNFSVNSIILIVMMIFCIIGGLDKKE